MIVKILGIAGVRNLTSYHQIRRHRGSRHYGGSDSIALRIRLYLRSVIWQKLNGLCNGILGRARQI